MKLRTRVIISFFVTIFVPIILCGVTFYLFSQYKVRAIGEQYGIENPTYEMLSNNTLMLDALTSREYKELYLKAQNGSADLENTEYLSNLNAKLVKDSSFLAVRKDDWSFFTGSDSVMDRNCWIRCRITWIPTLRRRAVFISTATSRRWSSRWILRSQTEATGVYLL